MLSVHTVLWIVKSNHPMAIIKDHMFKILMWAGQASLVIPTHICLWDNVLTCFEKCHNIISKLLWECKGRISFETDCWTSPNHRTLTAFIAHFESEGCIASFVADIVEVAEPHTGKALD